ncbi:MAG: tetratricopeptide repeat protein [Nitrospirae bacterium]|nr:tetratricopeptide repeat protein [Nitrospirota bacterium]
MPESDPKLSREISSSSTVDKFLKYILFLSLFALLVGLSVYKVSDPDVGLHLKTGELILKTGQIPKQDVFSYTVSGRSWIDHEWLFQVVLYLIYKLMGVNGLIIFKVATLSAAFLILLKIGGRKVNYAIVGFLFLLTVLVSSERFAERPEIITLLFVSIYLFILHSYRQTGKKFIFFLPLLQLLWVNIHGYFIVGIVLIFSYLLGGLMSESSCLSKRKQSLQLLAVGLISILVSFLNPNTYRGALFPFLTLARIESGSKIFMSNISELRPPFPSHNYPLSHSLYYARILIILSAASFFLNLKKTNIGNLLVYSIFLFLFLSAGRNIALFAFVALPLTLLNLKNISPKIRDAVKRIGREKHRRLLGRIGAVLLILVVTRYLVQIISNDYYLREGSLREFGLGFSELAYPRKAVDFIEKENIPGPMFNNFDIGNYLIWRLAPERKVFIDGRTELYGEGFYNYYQRLMRGELPYAEVVKRYNINFFLLSHASLDTGKLIVKLYGDSSWKMVYYDENSVIFVKDVPANRELIRKHKFTIQRKEFPSPYSHFDKGDFLGTIGFYDEAEYEFKEALKIYPPFSQAHNNLGMIYLIKGRYKEAAEEFKEAIKVNPLFAQAYYNLGMVYERRGDMRKAREEWKRTLAIDPTHKGARKKLKGAVKGDPGI